MSIPPPPLPPHLREPLGPDQVFADYIDVVRRTITNHPRSLQAALGPSEIGDPCQRRLVYKLTGVPERASAPNWKATIGTAGHAWMETAFDTDNLRADQLAKLEGQERWLIESTLVVGYVPGLGLISGHSDLYDRVSCSNWDHKFVGPTQMRAYRSKGPGDKYRIQAHLYGRGWELAGHPINGVGIVFLPRNGELAEAFYWQEAYDPQVAVDALERLGQLWRLTQALGAGAAAVAETADDWCSHCPFLRPGAPIEAGCPGHPGGRVGQTQGALSFGQSAQPALA